MLMLLAPPEHRLRTAALGNQLIPLLSFHCVEYRFKGSEAQERRLVKRWVLWSSIEMVRVQIKEVSGGMERGKESEHWMINQIWEWEREKNVQCSYILSLKNKETHIQERVCFISRRDLCWIIGKRKEQWSWKVDTETMGINDKQVL